MSTFRVLFYSTKAYDENFFTKAKPKWEEEKGIKFEFVFKIDRLTEETCELARGFDAVCIFVNDNGSAPVVRKLSSLGVKLILLRCAGFNNVDMKAAASCRIPVMRVPRYSPNAVAEHAVTLLTALTRRIYRSHERIKNHNFALAGLEGFDIVHKTVGVIGTGAIGKIMCRIMRGFGSTVIAYDPRPDYVWAASLNITYVTLDDLFKRSDIISLHVPLFKENHHIINAESIAKMKQDVTIINTSRGGLIDTKAAIEGLTSGKIRGLGIDVYENEAEFFFTDHSLNPMKDPVLAHLISLPNVLMTGHQAFFTEDALMAISNTTIGNAVDFIEGKAYRSANECTGLLKPKI